MNIPYVFKKCSKCGEWLVANNYNFVKHKACKWKLKNTCKICDRKYYEENKDRLKEKREENKDKLKKYKKEYYEENKDKLKEKREEKKEEKKKYDKEYRKNNKDKRREWRKNSEKYYKEYSKRHYKENPEKYFNYSNKRRLREENQGNGITKEQWLEMMNFFNWTCAYSGEFLGGNNKDKRRSIDHIMALDNGGEHEIWNLVPMVKSYNCSKNKRVDVINWYKEQEYFNEERLNKIVEWQIYAFNKWATENDELILINSL